MNQPPTLPPPRPHAPAPTAPPPLYDPQTGMALHPAAPHPAPVHPQAIGNSPGFIPAQGVAYPASPYPQPINIVVQNTNTMTQSQGAGALVRVANRNKWVAAALAFLLGGFGAHKFYLGQTGMGIVYLLFCWTFIPLFLSLFETLMLVLTQEREFDVRFNSQLAR